MFSKNEDDETSIEEDDAEVLVLLTKGEDGWGVTDLGGVGYVNAGNVVEGFVAPSPCCLFW